MCCRFALAEQLYLVRGREEFLDIGKKFLGLRSVAQRTVYRAEIGFGEEHISFAEVEVRALLEASQRFLEMSSGLGKFAFATGDQSPAEWEIWLGYVRKGHRFGAREMTPGFGD